MIKPRFSKLSMDLHPATNQNSLESIDLGGRFRDTAKLHPPILRWRVDIKHNNSEMSNVSTGYSFSRQFADCTLQIDFDNSKDGT